MSKIEFPIFKTKNEKSSSVFNLTDREEREEYFQQKVGKEIEKIRNYLKEGNTFIVYLLGKKNSGKGTYAKMFREIIDPENIDHLSIGDMIRDFDEMIKRDEGEKELISFLKQNYRGYMSLEEIMDSFKNRSTKNLLSSEFILALVKREIAQKKKKALFIDGFPRGMDQISYSLFFRDLINYREDPDFFALIDVPEKVIDERIKYRLVCPSCKTSRNLKFLPTKEAEYDEKEDKFYLICDNPTCKNVRMTTKEGDELGIENIKDRLKSDQELMERAFSLYGIPKILLRNSVPVEREEMVDDYEVTPEYHYSCREGKVEKEKTKWQIPDDNGVLSYSLMPPPVVVSLIRQLVDVLKI